MERARSGPWALLRTHHRGLTLGVAAVGVGLCVVVLVGFVATIVTNNLPWHPDQSPREYYQVVGRSFSHGFTVGFFLCFFLTMVAVTVDRWWRSRRARHRPAGEPAPSRRPSVSH